MSTQKHAQVVPWLAGLAVVVLVALVAVPSIAAPGGAKNYSASFSPTSVNAGTSAQAFSVLVTNTSPDTSSSNFSSLTIKVPSQFTGISNAVVVPPPGSSNSNSGAVVAIGTGNPSCRAVGATTQTINVCNIDPTKRLEKVKITFNANVSNSVACGSSNSDNWVVTPFTGSSLTGTGFTENPVNPAPYTVIQKTCLANISGQVWHDRNNNGTREASDGESGLSGWVVGAFSSSTFVKSATTGSDGRYTITNLPSGVTYKVCEFAPSEASGFEYRGWYQSSPGAAVSCTGLSGDEPAGATVQPNGNSVALAASGASNVDFFNVRTITVTCDISGDQTFTVGGGGDPVSSITISSAHCKTGEFVFESWVKPDGTQETDFYPTVPTGSTQPATQEVKWALTDKGQSTLMYDDDPTDNVGFKAVQFCETDGTSFSMPTGETTCLEKTTEDATPSGVARTDTILTLVDGKLRTSY
jgi:hypothetical protein